MMERQARAWNARKPVQCLLAAGVIIETMNTNGDRRASTLDGRIAFKKASRAWFSGVLQDGLRSLRENSLPRRFSDLWILLGQ